MDISSRNKYQKYLFKMNPIIITLSKLLSSTEESEKNLRGGKPIIMFIPEDMETKKTLRSHI